MRKVNWNISFYASKWTNRVAICIHILETVKIAHRPSVGDLIETWPCSTRLVFWPCGRVPSVPATKLLPIVRRGDARGQKRVKKRSTIDRVISVITPSLVMENAVSPVISREIEIFHEYPRRNRPVVILRSHIITTGVGTIIRRFDRLRS